MACFERAFAGGDFEQRKLVESSDASRVLVDFSFAASRVLSKFGWLLSGRRFFVVSLFCITMLPPNTALEPTAFTPVRSRFGRRLADDFCRRGSAFGR